MPYSLSHFPFNSIAAFRYCDLKVIKMLARTLTVALLIVFLQPFLVMLNTIMLNFATGTPSPELFFVEFPPEDRSKSKSK